MRVIFRKSREHIYFFFTLNIFINHTRRRQSSIKLAPMNKIIINSLFAVNMSLDACLQISNTYCWIVFFFPLNELLRHITIRHKEKLLLLRTYNRSVEYYKLLDVVLIMQFYYYIFLICWKHVFTRIIFVIKNCTCENRIVARPVPNNHTNKKTILTFSIQQQPFPDGN